MEDAENGKRGIEDDKDLNKIEKSLHRGELAKQSVGSIKSKKNRHEGSHIFPDHPDFMAFPIEIPDAQIIESPERRKKQRDQNREGRDDKETAHFKLPFR